MARTIDSSENVISLPTLANAVISGEIQLPHFQRPYVWPKQRRAEFFRSILGEYPLGSVLLWKATNRRGFTNPLNLGRDDMRTSEAEFLVVDGQQRLTTLAQQFFLAKKDRSDWGGFDGRVISALVVDLNEEAFESPGLFSWRSPDSVVGVDVAVFDKSKVLLAELLSNQFESKVFARLAGRSARRWISQGLRIRGRLLVAGLLAEFLPSRCDAEQAVQAFQRLNTGGSRLGVIDIAASNLFQAYPDLNDGIVDLHREVSQDDRGRPVFGAITREAILMSMLFKVYGSANPASASQARAADPGFKNQVREQWVAVQDQYRRLLNFLKEDLRLRDSDALETLYLVTAAEALSRPIDAESRNRLAEWLLRALIWLPYTGGATKSKLDADLRIVRGAASGMWDLLRENIATNATVHHGSHEITPAHFVGKKDRKPSKRSILHHCAWLAAHNNGAVDLVSGAPLPTHAGTDPSERWDRCPIFRKERIGVAEQSRLAGRMGNLVWLTRDTNRQVVQKSPPSEYLPRILRTEQGRTALASQAVPVSDLSLFNDPARFIDCREAELCRQMNDMLRSLAEGRGLRYDLPAVQLQATAQDILTHAARTEGPHLEFKQTFIFETEGWTQADFISHACTKAVASFANIGGGTLLIGVDAEGEVVGIEREKIELGKLDDLKQQMEPDERVARRELNLEFQKYVAKNTYPKGADSVAHPDCMQVNIEAVQGKSVIVVRVRQARKPIWVRRPSKGESVSSWVRYERHGAESKDIETRQGSAKGPDGIATPPKAAKAPPGPQGALPPP